jgi:hypothetical protein
MPCLNALQTIAESTQSISFFPITFLFFWPPQSTAGSGLRQEKLTPLLRSALACARFLLFSLRVKKINC